MFVGMNRRNGGMGFMVTRGNHLEAGGKLWLGTRSMASTTLDNHQPSYF